jgi:hypothetical protein
VPRQLLTANWPTSFARDSRNISQSRNDEQAEKVALNSDAVFSGGWTGTDCSSHAHGARCVKRLVQRDLNLSRVARGTQDQIFVYIVLKTG